MLQLNNVVVCESKYKGIQLFIWSREANGSMDELLLTLLIQIMIVLILELPFHTHVLPNSKAAFV